MAVNCSLTWHDRAESVTFPGSASQRQIQHIRLGHRHLRAAVGQLNRSGASVGNNNEVRFGIVKTTNTATTAVGIEHGLAGTPTMVVPKVDRFSGGIDGTVRCYHKAEGVGVGVGEPWIDIQTNSMCRARRAGRVQVDSLNMVQPVCRPGSSQTIQGNPCVSLQLMPVTGCHARRQRYRSPPRRFRQLQGVLIDINNKIFFPRDQPSHTRMVAVTKIPVVIGDDVTGFERMRFIEDERIVRNLDISRIKQLAVRLAGIGLTGC